MSRSKRIIVGCVAITVFVCLLSTSITINANSGDVTTTTTKVEETEQPTTITAEVVSRETEVKVVTTKETTTKVETKTTTEKATTTETTKCKETTTKKNKPATTKKDIAKSNDNKDNNSYKLRCKITHYCPCATCNGSSSGLTAMGTKLKPYKTVAVDKNVIPLGSTVVINGKEYIAEDTGVSGKTIDICVSSHSEAYDKGVYYADVIVYTK